MCPGFQGAESALCRDAGKPPSRALHPAPTTQGTSPEGGVLAGVTAVMISEAGGSGTAAPSPQGLLHCSVLQPLYTRRAMHPTADAQCLLPELGSGQESARRAAAQGLRAEEWAEMRELAQEADLALELVTVEVTVEVIAEAMEEATGEATVEATGRPQERSKWRPQGRSEWRPWRRPQQRPQQSPLPRWVLRQVRVCFQARGVWSCKRPCHQLWGGGTPRAAEGREGTRSVLSRPGWHPSLAESAGKPEAGRAAVDAGQRGQGLGPRVGWGASGGANSSPPPTVGWPRMSLSPQQPFLPRLLGPSERPLVV